MSQELITRLKLLIESEARSCSMDPGCITPEYVSRMWGGQVPIGQIEEALSSLKEIGDLSHRMEKGWQE